MLACRPDDIPSVRLQSYSFMIACASLDSVVPKKQKLLLWLLTTDYMTKFNWAAVVIIEKLCC